MLVFVLCFSVAVVCITATSPPGCNEMLCLKYCFNGFEVDEKGCPICKCRPDPPPVVKPGSCAPVPFRPFCTLELVIGQCTGDEFCPGEKKCCSKGCGKTDCRDPIFQK